MSQFSRSLESSDLNYIIRQRSTLLVGVLPLSIKDVEFTATNTTLSEGRDVEINGVYETATAEYVINIEGQSNIPSIGAILTDPTGRQIKVLDISRDDDENPVEATFLCNLRHINQ